MGSESKQSPSGFDPRLANNMPPLKTVRIEFHFPEGGITQSSYEEIVRGALGGEYVYDLNSQSRYPMHKVRATFLKPVPMAFVASVIETVESSARSVGSYVKGVLVTDKSGSIQQLRSLDMARRDWGSDTDIELWVDPGDADVETIKEVLDALSDLHVAHGGLGLAFRIDHDRIVVTEVAR